MLYPKSQSSEPRFFVIRNASGTIVRSGTVSENMIQMQCGEGETAQAEGAAEAWVDHVQALANPVLPLEQLRAVLFTKLATRRWEIECDGTTLGSNPVATDDRSKLLIVGAYAKARENPAYTTRWKSGAGDWSTIDAATIQAVHAAVFDWVQECFTREGELSDLVAAATTTEQLEQINSQVAKFWP